MGGFDAGTVRIKCNASGCCDIYGRTLASFAAVLFWRALSLARPGAPESVTSLAGLYWPVLSSVAAKLRDSPAAVSIDRTQGEYPGMVILMECVPGLSLMRLGVLPA